MRMHLFRHVRVSYERMVLVESTAGAEEGA
jgi:hypothetical protein